MWHERGRAATPSCSIYLTSRDEARMFRSQQVMLPGGIVTASQIVNNAARKRSLSATTYYIYIYIMLAWLSDGLLHRIIPFVAGSIESVVATYFLRRRFNARVSFTRFVHLLVAEPESFYGLTDAYSSSSSGRTKTWEQSRVRTPAEAPRVIIPAVPRCYHCALHVVNAKQAYNIIPMSYSAIQP